MPRSHGLPCDRKNCAGRCYIVQVIHSLRGEYLRRVRKCNRCGYRRKTVELFLPVDRKVIQEQ